MLRCAIFAALLCIASPISVSIGAVPYSLGLFAVMLCGVVLPWRQSLFAVGLYLLLGLCGLPLFAGGHSGLTALPGPTGGYLWSYLLIAPLISRLSQLPREKKLALPVAIGACLASIPLCYFCGTLQFSLLSGRSIQESLAVCVLPFLLPDCGKAVCAALLGVPVRALLARQAETT